MWQIVTNEKGFRLKNAGENVTPCTGQMNQSGSKGCRVYVAVAIVVLRSFVLLRIVQVGYWSVKGQDPSLR